MKTQTEIYYQSVHQYHTPVRHYRITLKVGVLDITAQAFHSSFFFFSTPSTVTDE